MDELIKAYTETDFKVYEPLIVIKVGQINKALDDLLTAKNYTTWAYITAWNPYSEMTRNELNEERNLQLFEDIKSYLVFEGEGVGTDPNWQAEKSFLILGIDRHSAILLGKKYRQNAIVVGVIQQPAELVWVK